MEFSRAGTLAETPLDALKIIRSDVLSGPQHSIYEPSVCFIVQGAKDVTVGQKVYQCEPGLFFASSANLPVVGRVTRATAAKPYLALILRLDSAIIYEIASATDFRKPDDLGSAGVFLDDAKNAMTDAYLRLMRSLGRQSDIEILAPLILKEITYYLMQSRFSGVLYDLAVQGSGVLRISRSIEKLRRDFSESVRVESLARIADMSPSAFYQHFKQLTGLSPIQFQKQLRLQEGRKLLATETEDITSVAYSVGYESPSQFSRDYSRLFGLAPSRDIKNLRQQLESAAQDLSEPIESLAIQ